MFARLVIALITSPIYGALAVLATLPLMVLTSIVLFVLASVTPEQGGVDMVVAAIIIVVLTAILSFLSQVLITVQTARYAGAFTGAKALRDQPPFMRAYWRGLLLILLVAIATFLVAFCAVYLLLEYWDGQGLPGQDLAELTAWLESLERSIDNGNPLDSSASSFGWAILGIRLFGMFCYLLLAVVLVPRVCGIGAEGGRTWSGPYFLFRILIGLPCCALMTAIIAELVLFPLELVTGGLPALIRISALIALESIVFGGAIFALEAAILKAGREVRDEARELLVELEKGDPQDYRALRQQWSDQ